MVFFFFFFFFSISDNSYDYSIIRSPHEYSKLFDCSIIRFNTNYFIINHTRSGGDKKTRDKKTNDIPFYMHFHFFLQNPRLVTLLATSRCHLTTGMIVNHT